MIRAATRDDLDRIWFLVKELADYERLADRVKGSPEALGRWLFDEPVVFCSVKEWDGQVVGCAIYFRTFSTFLTTPGVWLEDLFVLPEFRGRGFGKELLTHLLDEAKSQGYGRVEWSVLDWNEPAIGFYKAMGATVMPDWRICRFTLAE